jgi:hypothetical protein
VKHHKKASAERQGRRERFVMIPTALLVHTDWIHLPAAARVILIDICKMHHHGGWLGPSNNGQIGYGCAAGAKAASVSIATADRMLNRIRKGGLLKLRKEGIFNVKAGEGRTREWQITIYPMAGRPLTAWGESKLHIEHWLLDSAAYKGLSNQTKCILIELMRRYNGGNNGSISFGGQDGARAGFSVDVTERAPRPDPTDADHHGRIAVIETKSREPQFALSDQLSEDHLPEPVTLTPEQIAAQKETDERDRQRQLEWAIVIQALNDNSMAVTRAMRQWHPREGDRERQVERVLTSYEDGSFLIDRLGAGMVVDQDLAVVLLGLRRRLKGEYGETPAAMMLIDRAVSAYQDFMRVTGWVGNLALHIEHEFFGRDGPGAQFRDRHGLEGRTIRGLTVEEHLAHLREGLIPLAERCGRLMREALAALEMLRAAPSTAVEKLRPVGISVVFEPTRSN